MKNTITKLMMSGALLVSTFATALPAQTAAPAPDGTPKAHRKIAARKEEQQKRIAQGVQSGQLTAGETAKLENRESKINKEIRADRKANGGNLTNNQKKQVALQQKKLSKKIYDDKHNTAVQPK